MGMYISKVTRELFKKGCQPKKYSGEVREFSRSCLRNAPLLIQKLLCGTGAAQLSLMKSPARRACRGMVTVLRDIWIWDMMKV